MKYPLDTHRLWLPLVAILLSIGLSACSAPPADSDAALDTGEEFVALTEDAPETSATTLAQEHTPTVAAKPAATPSSATKPAAVKPAAILVTVPAGTELHVSLTTPVHSGTNLVGDLLTATMLEDVWAGEQLVIPAGSLLHGELTEVVPAKKGLKVKEKSGAATLAFTHAELSDGTMVELHASISADAKSGAKTGGIIGGSAAGGAVLGKILGDDSKDTATGAAVGAGIGAAIAAGTKGKNLKLPEGTELIVVLDEDLTFEF